MTDDDNIRLSVLCAVLQSGQSAGAAWDASEYILDRWHATQPYAPPFKCVHGKTRDEACAQCESDTPLFPVQIDPPTIKVVGVEP